MSDGIDRDGAVDHCHKTAYATLLVRGEGLTSTLAPCSIHAQQIGRKGTHSLETLLLNTKLITFQLNLGNMQVLTSMKVNIQETFGTYWSTCYTF